MKKGIPCFDYFEVGVKGQSRIDFQFVSEGDEVVSSSMVSLGDVDPLTGEALTDLTFFREYHLQRNREVYRNKREFFCPESGKVKRARQALREQIAADFERNYGYAPDAGTLSWLVSEKMPKQYRRELDGMYNDEGEYRTDCSAEFADPVAESAFRRIEEEGHSLDDFEKTLSPFQQDVFRLFRMKSEGIPVHGMGKRIAEKWGKEKSAVSKAKLQVGELLKRWMAEE